MQTNFSNSFIKALKLLVDALIFFICKANSSFYLCANYQGLNNLTIKNQYLLPLIGEFLDWLGWAKYKTVKLVTNILD